MYSILGRWFWEVFELCRHKITSLCSSVVSTCEGVSEQPWVFTESGTTFFFFFFFVQILAAPCLLSHHPPQVSVWKYPTMQKIADLTGHTKRVLHLSQNPEGTTIVSGGGEMLRFWKVWEKPRVVRGGEGERGAGGSPLSQFHSYSVR